MDGLVNIFPYRDGIQDAVKRLKYRFVREMKMREIGNGSDE